MTCIVGLVENDTVYLGGDSAGVDVNNNYGLQLRRDRKVFDRGPYVIGFTSSYRMGQLLRYELQPPPPPESPVADLFGFMVEEFVGRVRSCLKQGGWLGEREEREYGGEFLVGVQGRLFRVESYLQVTEEYARYDAVGSGAHVALGAMYATEAPAGAAMEPESRIKLALRAAERHNAGVRGPYIICSVASSGLGRRVA